MSLPLISTLMVCFVRGTLPSSAKPQLQLCWLAELALLSVNPAPPPPPGKVYLVAVAN